MQRYAKNQPQSVASGPILIKTLLKICSGGFFSKISSKYKRLCTAYRRFSPKERRISPAPKIEEEMVKLEEIHAGDRAIPESEKLSEKGNFVQICCGTNSLT